MTTKLTPAEWLFLRELDRTNETEVISGPISLLCANRHLSEALRIATRLSFLGFAILDSKLVMPRVGSANIYSITDAGRAVLRASDAS